MNKQQKLTAFLLSLSLLSGNAALASSGAPTSQFGFKGWPYCNSCIIQDAETATPVPTPAATPAPAAKPTVKPTATAAPTAKPPADGDDYTTPSISAQEENAFILLNQDRIANGLPALKLDPELSRIARAKSRDMNDKKYFSHTSPTFGNASDMLRHFGYSFNGVAENIAHHATIEKSQAAFMSSSGHRRNLLGSQWSKVGIGVWKDAQGFVYVTQLFVR